MTSFVDTARPENKSLGMVYDFLCVLTGSLFIALCAQVSIDLWFTPVPLTLQTLAVLLVGATLGSKKGALSVVAYFVQAAVGLPVLAGGRAGLIWFAGPSGGYLFAMLICAYMVGFLLERGWNRSYFLTASAFGFGLLSVLAIGALWLSFFTGLGNAFGMGITPFLPGELCKILIGAALVPSATRFRHLFG